VITDRLRRPRGAEPEPERAPASALERRRDDLAHQVAELQFDLGGLAYEMAIRDHFRLEVLTRRAAELQHADAELAEVERMLAAEQRSEAGSCPSCGAPHSRGAAFCWQCGAALLSPT
jgi:DNA repair exonuclease SbcCD ATPase subunit